MIFSKRKRKGYILIQTVLAMLATMMLSYSLFTITSGQFSMIQASRVGLQAQQYAQIDANTLQLLSYDDLDSNGAHSRQTLTSVANATDWQDEITIGSETVVNADSENKQRIATIKIYKEGDTLSRYSLQVPLSSKGSNSEVPVGTIIIWALDSMPSGSESGKWLECNGQAIDSTAYPELALLMSNTPNYQGVFLRGYGSQSYTDPYGTVTHSSGELSIIQGDVIRNITGKTTMGTVEDTGNPFHGVFYNSGTFSGAGSGWSDYGLGFDASLVVPTGNENRPINKAVKYLIKAK